MVLFGIVGLAAWMVVVDPLQGRTWAAGLVVGLVLIGTGLLGSVA